MLEFAEVKSLPEPDELLTSLGYDVKVYSFHFVGSENYAQSQSGKGYNMSSTAAETVSDLVTELEQNSCVETRYISQDFNSEIGEKFSDLIEQYVDTGFQEFPYQAAENAKNVIEEEISTEDPENMPGMIQIPHNFDVEFSKLEEYKMVCERIENLGYDVQEIMFSSGHPNQGEEIDEIQRNLNHSVLTFKTGKGEVNYFNTPENSFTQVFPEDEDIEGIFSEEF